jgi:hypothetical protein
MTSLDQTTIMISLRLMPHCPNSTLHSSISLLRMSVLPARSCQNRETLNKTSTAPRSPESIQVTLPRPPLPLLETALRSQVLQRHQPLQAHLLRSRARLTMTIAKSLSSHSSQGSGARCVQTVALSSFNHISTVTQRHTPSPTPAAYSQTAHHALRNNEIENDTKRDMANNHRAQYNSSVLTTASGV